MRSRTEIVCRGWLYALPYVLSVPVLLGLMLGPFFMIKWSWGGLLEIYQYGVPILLMAALWHLFGFLIFGLPMFFAFWKRPSIVWVLPVSLSLGLLIGFISGSIFYILLGHEMLFFAVVYGVMTSFSCWLANRRSERVAGPKRPQPPAQNSMSPARSPEDW